MLLGWKGPMCDVKSNIKPVVNVTGCDLDDWGLICDETCTHTDDCRLVTDARERRLCSTERQTCRYPDPQHLWLT